jgi:predicted TIM-barrel fold metal-dependent hydrolase
MNALQRVLTPLPPDFPAAVVVLQHQRPGHRSLLAPLQARNCRLPTRDARNGDALTAGTVLLDAALLEPADAQHLHEQRHPILAFAKPGHIVFGSDWPFAPQAAVEQFAEGLDHYPGMDEAVRQAIGRDNAAELLEQ